MVGDPQVALVGEVGAPAVLDEERAVSGRPRPREEVGRRVGVVPAHDEDVVVRRAARGVVVGEGRRVPRLEFVLHAEVDGRVHAAVGHDRPLDGVVVQRPLPLGQEERLLHVAHGAQVRRRLAGARVRVRRLPHRALPASVVGERQLAGRHALVVEPRGHVIGQVVLGEVERQPLLAEHDRLERAHGRHDPAGAVAVLRAHGGQAVLRAQVERRRVRTGGLPGRRARGRGRGGGAGERGRRRRGAGGALRQAAGERGQRGQRDDQQKAGSRAPLHDAPVCTRRLMPLLSPGTARRVKPGSPAPRRIVI